jgi:hypothetical protein
VTQVVGVQLIGPSESWLTTEHIAEIITVVKGTGSDLAEGNSLHFWQTYAGEWIEDGKRIVGESSPYRVGDEFVGLFTREEDGKLVESVAGRFMYRVVAGKVVWSGRPTPGIQDGMPVDAFIAALRQIMALE